MGERVPEAKKSVDRFCSVPHKNPLPPSKIKPARKIYPTDFARPHTAPRMNVPPPADTPFRAAPLALWRAAAAFLHMLYALFGEPAEVAARHTLRLEMYKSIASWLAAGEAMMRRLLLIEAAAFPKPNIRPLLPKPRQRVRKLIGFAAEHPERWRVSFRCFTDRPRRPTKPRPHVRTGRVSREDRWSFENFEPVKFRSAWPLAERYEALLRVFNDPSACARRLAHRLHAAPHRVAALLRAPPEAERRVENFADLTTAAATRAALFNSS